MNIMEITRESGKGEGESGHLNRNEEQIKERKNLTW